MECMISFFVDGASDFIPRNTRSPEPRMKASFVAAIAVKKVSPRDDASPRRSALPSRRPSARAIEVVR